MSAAPSPPDASALATHPDPGPLYAQLALQHPLRWDAAAGRWIAAGAGAVREALLHPALHVRPPHAPVPPALAGSPLGELFGRFIRMTEGPAREPLRRAVALALAEVPDGRVRALAQEGAEALMPAAPAEGAAVTTFAFALPLHTVGRLLGIAPGALPGTVLAAQQLALALSPLATTAQREAGASAAAALEVAIAHARGGPLLEALHRHAPAHAAADGTLRANAVGLLLQTCEATAGLIGNTLVALGREPERGARPLDAGALDAVLDEVLRLDPPVHSTRRYAAEELTLQGARVQPGQEVLLLLAAAGRDAAAPPPPACPHLAFGLGRHACPGAALARSLAALAVARVLAVGVSPAALARSFHYRPSLNGRLPLFTGATGAEGGQP